MPCPVSSKRTVYSHKKIVLMMILVFSGVCFWPAQALLCHHCNSSEHCINPEICMEEETVCVSEIVKMPNYTSAVKKCFTACEDLLIGPNLEENEASRPGEPIIPNTTSEISEITNKRNIFKERTPMEHTITCCDINLCNQARVRDPGYTVLILGLHLSFLWLLCCSVL